MDRVAIDLGIIQIYWYSIFILLAVLVSCMVIYRESIRQGIDKDFVVDAAFSVIVFGILGARLYYILFNLKYYLSNPLEMLEIWNGGLAIHGGIIFGSLAAIYQCKKHDLEILKMFDIIVVGLIIGQAIGRWGNFFNGEAYGKITTLEHLKSLNLPDFVVNGMYILGEYREPTFLYESILNIIGFIVLLVFRRMKYTKKGQVTGLYFMWYSLIRFIIEAKRTDSLMLGSIKVAQLMSIILFVVGFILFIYYSKIKKVSKFDQLYKYVPKKLSEDEINPITGKEKRPLFTKEF